MEKEFRDYWAKINGQKSSSPSDRYVGLYKAMAIAAMDPVIKDQQRSMMEVIRQISKACMMSIYIYILDQWRLASDGMHVQNLVLV